MRRVSTSTAAPNLHGVGKPGFTGGNAPAGIFPTEIGAEFCNGVQEELVGCIEASGQTLDAEDNLQVAKAIPYLAGHNIDPAADDLAFGWNSESEPTVVGSGFYLQTDTATTSSDLFAVLCVFTPPTLSHGSAKYTINTGLIGSNGSPGTIVVQIEWYKTALNVTGEDTGFKVLYDKNAAALDYELFHSGGSFAIKVKPNLGEDPDQNYNVFVVGEFFVNKQ